MPIYEFRCKSCQHMEEILQKVNDPAPEVCPECGKKSTLIKVVSNTSFQLKGGGWYSDLYASTPKASSASSETVTKVSSSSSDSKKSS